MSKDLNPKSDAPIVPAPKKGPGPTAPTKEPAPEGAPREIGRTLPPIENK